MTAMYHRRFFFDVNFTTVLVLALFVLGWAALDEAFLLVPIVALMGAVATAFDASYLIFARTYAARLERYLNDELGSGVLIAAEMESVYLFPLGTSKIVTIPIGGGFTWFAFVTIAYTVIGAASYLFGLALGWNVLIDGPVAMMTAYLGVLIVLTLAALFVGVWWFATGEGEGRLAAVIDARFDRPSQPGSQR